MSDEPNAVPETGAPVKTASTTWTFNPNQLATWDDARALAAQIETFRITTGVPMGGGVKPETADANTSGLYVPSWVGGPGGFPEPNDVENLKYWLHFRFQNGASGINVGLILDKLVRYGGNTMYVFSSLANDLQQG
jgi:hypothetical protein